MKIEIFKKSYASLPFDEKEILRYAGCKAPIDSIKPLLASCISEASTKIAYRLCYCRLPVTITENTCDFGVFRLVSRHLARSLASSEETILFAATLGLEMDRLISRYGRLSPAKGLIFQAIGAAQIEMLCDSFCRDLSAETGRDLLPRFSPGYGDLPLDIQKDIFRMLDCQRNIGLTLNDSLLMIPSKSVTAFAGIKNKIGSNQRGVL